jgi:hypothetical protein
VITKRGDKTYFITKGPLHYDPNPCAVFSLKSFFKFCTGVWTQGLPLKPLHQPFFFLWWVFFSRDRVLRTICPRLALNCDPPE